ncbi:MAG: helix-turn-helix domain-containing protein [Verrucomicrobiales bacterium]|jgi:putative transcriptional regulator|nr:helix-turn-helix domain-containing protein [Verrucomicrobiales bacterium]
MIKKIEKNYLFSGSELIASAREGLDILRAGKIDDLRTTTLELPTPVSKIAPIEIRRIRTRMGASQAVFARLLNVPKRTAIAWERGERKPSGAALKLLHIAKKQPEILAIN